MKRESGAWGYNWAALSLGDINTETWYSRLGVGHKADDLVLKNIITAKFKEVKTRSNLAKTSKEGCISKRAVLLMIFLYFSYLKLLYLLLIYLLLLIIIYTLICVELRQLSKVMGYVHDDWGFIPGSRDSPYHSHHHTSMYI
jgi:hypothetical protein